MVRIRVEIYQLIVTLALVLILILGGMVARQVAGVEVDDPALEPVATPTLSPTPTVGWWGPTPTPWVAP